MYSTYNEGKSVVAERFIRALENKIFKHMRAISKNVYFDVLDDIVNKYNNTVHRSIQMKPIDVTSDLMLNTMKILMKNTLNSKLVIMLEFQNTKFRIEKVFKRKGDKLYVKWKGYENSFNSSIDNSSIESILLQTV